MFTKQEKYVITFENCDYFVDLGLHIACFRKKPVLHSKSLLTNFTSGGLI